MCLKKCNLYITASYPGPVVINVRTDEDLKGYELSGTFNSSLEAQAFVAGGGENGFRLTYTQNLNANCNRPI